METRRSRKEKLDDGHIQQTVVAVATTAGDSACLRFTDPVFIVDDLHQAAVLGLARRRRHGPLRLVGFGRLLLELLL